jgi:hypothetical protein
MFFGKIFFFPALISRFLRLIPIHSSFPLYFMALRFFCALFKPYQTLKAKRFYANSVETAEPPAEQCAGKTM